MTAGAAGVTMLWVGLAACPACVAGYVAALLKPSSRRALVAGRLAFVLCAAALLSVFATLAALVYFRQYQYVYVFSHTSNDLHGWYRLAAMWSAQEGSFLLWGFWTAVIGLVVLRRAGAWEARVMPVYVTVLGFLCAILLKQTPFTPVPVPSHAQLLAHPDWHFPPLDGRGLVPSLVNYWMTIHPPTIFFGFASLLVPFSYAIAAMASRDYDGWTARVMPYALLTSATLGVGLFFGGYWAYETQGWHGFWAWDPVENASFFPWLAVTGLVHGCVVAKSRGGMARTNTLLAVLAFWLFLLGTFLTRSGALAGKDASGQMLSVHAFDNIGKSALSLMVAMLIAYGVVGAGLWLVRMARMPGRRQAPQSVASRDFAFYIAMTLMVVACIVIALGTTTPLLLSWAHRAPTAPKPAFYNKVMLPLCILTALVMAAAPWLAWRRTSTDTFIRKLTIPWVGMLLFGFGMVFWVQSAQRNLAAAMPAGTTSLDETMHAWMSPRVQLVAVLVLTAAAVLAALSNATLAVRVFRRRPLAAGGWLAHVGIATLMIGAIVSNTFERTERVTLHEGAGPQNVFGYSFNFERMTGRPIPGRPMNPDYDPSNAVEMRVTPPDGSGGSDTAGTYLADLRWYVHNLRTEDDESRFERMQWPYIHKYLGHDLYIGLADNPGFQVPALTLKPGEHREIGPYGILYTKPIVQPGQYIAARVFLRTPDGKILQAQPGMKFLPPEDGSSMPRRVDVDVSIPDAPDANGVPGAIYLQRLDAATQSATLLVNLPGYNGVWDVPIEVTFKPWINLVWLGVAITGLGTLLAMVRRWRELDGIAVDADVDEALGRQQTDAAKAVPPGAAPRKRPVPAHTTR